MAAFREVVDSSTTTLCQLNELKIWSKELDQVQQLDLILLAKRVHMITNDRRRTGQVMDYVMDSINRAKLIGLGATRATSLPDNNELCMTTTQLCKWLNEMELPRRRCFLFALLTGMRLDEAMSLTWKDLNKLQHKLPAECVRLAHLNPRHIRSDLVFYELKNQSPVSLAGLDIESLMVTGFTWKELLKASDNFIPDAADEVWSLMSY